MLGTSSAREVKEGAGGVCRERPSVAFRLSLPEAVQYSTVAEKDSWHNETACMIS